MNENEKGAKTTYRVLRKAADPDGEIGEVWLPIAQLPAASSDAAVRECAEEDGVYVAVPFRSFKPVTVTVETKREVRLG